MMLGGSCEHDEDISADNNGNGAAEREESSKRTMNLVLEEGGKLVLQEDRLKQLLNPEILQDMPIAIVSIAGAFRLGKSFMLNLCLCYLQKHGWKDNEGNWLNNWNSLQDKNIEWKEGLYAHTSGIIAWGEPIIVEDSNGSKLAVILLDTQGTFSHGQKKNTDACIFTLSTLFSSLQIFNVARQIQANDLEYLQLFVEYAKSTSPKKTNAETAQENLQKSFFQKLLFLVRDWQWSEPTYGSQGGDDYLSKLSDMSLSEDGVYDYLKHAFDELKCHLMPQPADCVRNGENQIEGSNIGEKFYRHVLGFMDEHMHPDKLAKKCFGTDMPATAKDLLTYMRQCADKVLSGNLPDHPNLLKLVAETAYQKASDLAKDSFETVIDEMKQHEVKSWEDFDRIIEMKKSEALSKFKEKLCFGIEEIQIQRYNDSLHKHISDIIPKFEKLMASRRLEYIDSRTKELIEDFAKKLKKSSVLSSRGKLEEIKNHYLDEVPEVDDDRDNSRTRNIVENAKTDVKEKFANFISNRKTKIIIRVVAGAAATATVIAVIAVAGPIAAAVVAATAVVGGVRAGLR